MRTLGIAKPHCDSVNMLEDYLVKIINSFDQHRIVNLLHLSTFSFFNFINICNPERGITVNGQQIQFFNMNSAIIGLMNQIAKYLDI